MSQDPSNVVDHSLDDLLGGEDFAVFLEAVFYRDDTLFESFGFGVTTT